MFVLQITMSQKVHVRHVPMVQLESRVILSLGQIQLAIFVIRITIHRVFVQHAQWELKTPEESTALVLKPHAPLCTAT
jgi:hypothetical protein